MSSAAAIYATFPQELPRDVRDAIPIVVAEMKSEAKFSETLSKYQTAVDELTLEKAQELFPDRNKEQVEAVLDGVRCDVKALEYIALIVIIDEPTHDRTLPHDTRTSAGGHLISVLDDALGSTFFGWMKNQRLGTSVPPKAEAVAVMDRIFDLIPANLSGTTLRYVLGRPAMEGLHERDSFKSYLRRVARANKSGVPYHLLRDILEKSAGNLGDTIVAAAVSKKTDLAEMEEMDQQERSAIEARTFLRTLLKKVRQIQT